MDSPSSLYTEYMNSRQASSNTELALISAIPWFCTFAMAPSEHSTVGKEAGVVMPP